MNLARFFAWLDDPHICGDCGRLLDYGHNDAGKWWIACPKVTLHVGDGYLERNFEGMTVRVTGSRPRWTCDHDHLERPGYAPSVGWWEDSGAEEGERP